jgi:hypothetical protein
MKRKTDEKQTILSQQDVMEMQMVEGLSEKDQSVMEQQRELPDMSVGWYASPPHGHDD